MTGFPPTRTLSPDPRILNVPGMGEKPGSLMDGYITVIVPAITPLPSIETERDGIKTTGFPADNFAGDSLNVRPSTPIKAII
jgi:hypothetical protein